MKYSRRLFVKTIGTGSAALLSYPDLDLLAGYPLTVEVVNPYNRVPVSLIIDDIPHAW